MGKRNTQKNEAASTKGKKQNKKQVVKEVEEKVLVPQTKKPRKFSQKVRARRKVKESQGSTKLIFARRTFQRLVRKCLEEVAPEKSWRVSANSFKVLQEKSFQTVFGRWNWDDTGLGLFGLEQCAPQTFLGTRYVGCDCRRRSVGRS